MDSQQTLTLLSQPKASPDTNGIPSVQVHSEDPAESRGRRMDSHRDGTATLKPPEPARGSSRSRSPLGRRLGFAEKKPFEKFRTVARMARVMYRIQAATYMKKYTGDSKKLCRTCSKLELHPNKFVIHDHAADRNHQAGYLYARTPTLRRRMSSFPLGSGSGKILLGTFQQIRDRRTTCPFCFLVISSLKQTHDQQLSDIPEDQQDIRCEVSWNVDGREAILENGVIKQTRARTRRIRLHWNTYNPKFADSYLVMVGREPIYNTHTSQRPWESESLFLGRRIKIYSQNIDLIKDWLGHCDDYHGDHCKIDRGSRFEQMIKGYFGVIDIHTMSITHLPKDAHYVALSYVWGEGPRYQTTLEVVEDHKKDGGIQKAIEYLPAVVRESIELVRALKHRYLWVDSLCVVQNSRKSWNLNSQVMDLVYGNAYLTICAADGKSAKDSLKAVSPTPRSITQYIEECGNEGVTLMVSHLAETFIKRSKWNTRGWTFQERLLSKRCLIFAEGRMFFQCRSTAMSEDIVTEQKLSRDEHNNLISTASWSIELVQAPLQLLHQLETRSFRVYMTCMELYTDRVLSKPKDILAAFNGMSNLIGKAMGSPLLFGLPSSHFDLSLLWQPRKAIFRRKPSIKSNNELSKHKNDIIRAELQLEHLRNELSMECLEGKNDTSDQNLLEQIKALEERKKDLQPKIQDYEDYGEIRFPSWSWCGWIGEGDAKAIPSQLYYNSEMLEGCLSNVHSWLIEHTWIHWYIRDQHGDLRRVWSATSQENCKSDSRWKGYGTQTSSDCYGRSPRPELKDKPQHNFERTLPDYPFRVSFADSEKMSDSETDHVYLQFWTWSAVLKVFPCESIVSKKLGEGLRRYDITDYTGDWCGSIVLDATWAERNVDKSPGAEHEFLAISEAKNFTEEENDIWTYYIPKERNQADWDLYYVLLVEHDRRGIASRVGLGKVFKEAFSNSCLPGLEWKEIILD